MTSQAWAVIGVGVALVAAGIASFGLLWNAINGLGAGLGARIDAQGAELGARIDALGGRVDGQGLRIDALGLRIDGIEHELHSVNRTLGELVGRSHVHDQAA
jgi:hypothetical protein